MIKNKLTPKDFIYMEDKVVYFNECMGNDLENQSLVPTYQKLSFEEVNLELLDAIKNSDKVETLDALIDGVFTVFYWALLEDKANTLSEAKTFLLNCCSKESLSFVNIHFLARNIEEGDAYSAQTELVALLNEYQNQFDIMGAFNNVYESNMSKFAVEGALDVPSEIKRIEKEGRYADITVESITTSTGLIYQAFKAGKDLKNDVVFAAPKLVKPSTFKEPDLVQFIY